MWELRTNCPAKENSNIFMLSSRTEFSETMYHSPQLSSVPNHGSQLYCLIYDYLLTVSANAEMFGYSS